MAGFGRQTLRYTAATIVQKALAFFYFAMVARYLGPEETGAYSIVLSIASLVGLVADLGCTPVLIRDLVGKSADEQRSLVGTIWRAKAVFALVGVLVGWLAAWGLGYDHQPLAIWLAIGLAVCEASYTALYGMWRASHQLGRESLGVMLGQVVVYGVGIGILAEGGNWVALPLALLVGGLFHVVWAGWRWRTLIAEGFFSPRVVRTPWELVWAHAWPFAVSASAVKLLSTADIWFLELTRSTLEQGQYSAISRFVYAFQFVPLAIIAGLYPAFSASFARGETLEHRRALLVDATRYLAGIGWPLVIGMLVSAPTLLPRLYNDAYAPALVALPGLAFSLLCIFMDVPLGALLNAAKRQREKMGTLLAGLAVNVLFDAALIPLYGMRGASWSAAAAFACMLFLSVWRASREVPRVWALLGRVNMPPALAALGMGVVVHMALPMLGLFAIPLGVMVYAGLGYATGAWERADFTHLFRLSR
jgi:O-antigen/teichoic acid export membrane protein